MGKNSPVINGRTTQSSKLSEVLSDLNPPQLEAVKHHMGPILVLAGAGSGKTRILTRRIAHLVLGHGVRPERILAVTFTNKATQEMRGRLYKMLGTDAERLWVSTFHSGAARMLRQHAHLLGYSNAYTIYDDQDSRGLLKEVVKEAGLKDKEFNLRALQQSIDHAKNNLILPSEYFEKVGKAQFRKPNQQEDMTAELYRRYQEALMKSDAMDFGDLLMNIVLIFKKHPTVLANYRRAFQFVLVDEFQDTNLVQYMFTHMLVSEHRNILVVGDDDQSIYAFRGADIRNILDFEKDFPETKVVTLEQNYRSSAAILECAHEVIKKNQARKPKKLWTEKGTGAKIATFLGDDEIEEARFIAGEISEFKGAGLSLNSVAIFYRTNAQSRAIEEALMNASIPYRIFGGLKFYERKEVKDILAFLRLLVNESDSQAFVRAVNTPPRGIGPQTLRSILSLASERSITLLSASTEIAKRSNPVRGFVEIMEALREAARKCALSELIRTVINLTDYDGTLKASKDPQAVSRLENLMELEAIGRALESRDEENFEVLKKFLDRVSLASGGDMSEEKDQSNRSINSSGEATKEMVTLMTLHLAKGLEFPVVFLTGLEEGLLPHYLSINDSAGVDEERRLCYVGITRAMERLYITRAYSRGMFSGSGFGAFRDVSRFAFDLPEGLLDHRGPHFIGWSSSDSYAVGNDFQTGGSEIGKEVENEMATEIEYDLVDPVYPEKESESVPARSPDKKRNKKFLSYL